MEDEKVDELLGLELEEPVDTGGGGGDGQSDNDW